MKNKKKVPFYSDIFKQLPPGTLQWQPLGKDEEVIIRAIQKGVAGCSVVPVPAET